MADDALLAMNDQSDPRSLALLPAGGLEQQSGEWNGPPAIAKPSGLAGLLGPEVAVYLHAFRRHWLLSLGIGLVAAAAAGVAAWFGVGTKYTASAALKVEMQERSVLTGGVLSPTDRDRFEIFKNTQQNNLLSRFVLLAALRKPEVAKTRTILEEQKRGGDAVGRLQRLLSVGFPGRGELMQVSISREDPHEAAVLVNSVVESYLTDVVKAEEEQKGQRLTKLDTACAEKEQQIRNTRSELKNLAQSYGTSDSASLTQVQKLMLDDYALYHQEWARRQFDVAELESQVAAQQAMLKSVDAGEVETAEVEAMLANDPVTRELQLQLAYKKREQMMNQGAVVPGSKNKYAQKYDREIKGLEDEYATKTDEARNKVRQRKRLFIEMKLVELKTSLETKRQQHDVLSKKLDSKKEEMAKIGVSTVDMEMLQANLKQLEAVYSELNGDREKTRVELKSAPRISLVERAEDPLLPSNAFPRTAITALAILMGFCCPAVVVVLWDTRTRRINSADDVSQGLRLPVIGSVPLIPSRVIRNLGSPSRRSQSWHIRLTESVDGITARVLHKVEIGQCRVIMVSSATGGEGKTTLATQLAMSLARTKRRVVLVDFDLRRPSFDEMFGVPLEPGVCELLRHQSTVSELMRPSGTENLNVIPAGRWDRQTLASLSNGCAGAMFQQLRDAYDFVVVDTSPLLPVADARFVSQHVDAVVLSVLRDISQAPKIQAACDILAAFGVPSVEAVVTGASYNLYGHHRYESTIPA